MDRRFDIKIQSLKETQTLNRPEFRVERSVFDFSGLSKGTMITSSGPGSNRLVYRCLYLSLFIPVTVTIL